MTIFDQARDLKQRIERLYDAAKDRSINEPVQFLLSRASQPYELVVNEVRKDMISGYVSAPKVQTPRGSASN